MSKDVDTDDRFAGKHSHITAPMLHALPPEPLRFIFDLLSEKSGCMSSGSVHALALAASCRALDRFYRWDYVTALEMSTQQFLADRHPDALFRALQRFPRVSDVRLNRIRFMSANGGYRVALVGSGDDESVARAQRITRLSVLSSSPSAEEFQLIAATCSHLVGFHFFHNVRYEAYDEGISAFVRHAPPSLLELTMEGSDVCDDAFILLPNLCRLVKLNISLCRKLTDASFAELRRFGGTLVDLDLHATRVSTVCAVSLLSHLQILQRLNLRGCGSLGPPVFAALPASLVELNVSETSILDNSVPHDAFASMPDLVSLTAYACPLTDFSVLLSLKGRLKALEYAHASTLDAPDVNGVFEHSDLAVSQLIVDMNQLEKLRLCSRGAADQTARAIASLPHLRCLDLQCSSMSNAGVRALARGQARLTLESITFSFCRIDNGDGVVDELRAALKCKTASVTF
jgi:hypothetical protein